MKFINNKQTQNIILLVLSYGCDARKTNTNTIMNDDDNNTSFWPTFGPPEDAVFCRKKEGKKRDDDDDNNNTGNDYFYSSYCDCDFMCKSWWFNDNLCYCQEAQDCCERNFGESNSSYLPPNEGSEFVICPGMKPWQYCGCDYQSCVVSDDSIRIDYCVCEEAWDCCENKTDELLLEKY